MGVAAVVFMAQIFCFVVRAEKKGFRARFKV